MATTLCPVKRVWENLSEVLSDNRESPLPCRGGAEELFHLVDDICSGKGRSEHLSSIEKRAVELAAQTFEKSCVELGQRVLKALKQNQEVFHSHILAHYCPTGECSTLTAAPCQLACPASVDAPSYVALVGQGRYNEALEVLREDLPFPGSLGRICIHPCEKACRRGEVDAPISICRLKRVAFDKAYGEGMPTPKPTPREFEEKIAIIGAGPAGLSTGYFLAKKGYRPTVFEAKSEPGGMLRWGIPAYRLPPTTVELEIDYIKALGVQIKTGIVFGKDLTVQGLQKQGYRAIFLGMGAWKPMRLGIRGEHDFAGVQNCLSFLYEARLGKAKVGKRVLVLGGGNAAVDCARTAGRLDVDEVHLVYRRTKKEMPANAIEVQEAEQEGVILDFLLSPVRVHGKNGKVTGLECIRNGLSEPDATGRRRPVPLEGTEHILLADTIISAIGQEVDTEPLKAAKDLELTYRHLITVDPLTMETNIPGVFAGGDVVTGPATVIEAVAAGKKAAEAIHRDLRGMPHSEFDHLPKRRQQVPVSEVSADEKSLPARPTMPLLDLDRRQTSFSEVELGLSEKSAREEAKRCLRCDICIGCGRCVEICGDLLGVDAIHLSYVEENKSPETDFRRPKERCIGCGSCAVNCPTQAITMVDGNGTRTLWMCGGEMSRHEMVACGSCGEYFITARQLAYIKERSDAQMKIKYPRDLCPHCARSAGAKNLKSQFSFY